MNGRESIQLFNLARVDHGLFIQNHVTTEIRFSEGPPDEYKESYPSLSLTEEQALSRSKRFTTLARLPVKRKSFLKLLFNQADSWSTVNKIISTDYGKDSCLYFKLSRWMKVHAAIISLVCLSFLVIPMLVIYSENRPENSAMPDYINILLSTNKWLVDTPIFYGFYNQSQGSYSNSVYSISRAYFWVNVLTRLVYILFLLRKFIFSLSRVYTERYSSSVLQSTINMNYILCMWDFRACSKRSRTFCKVNIKDFIKRICTPKKISSKVTKKLNIFINVLCLIIIVLCLERVSWLITEDEIFMQRSSVETMDLGIYLRSPVVVSLVVVTVAWVFDLLKCIEDYPMEYFEVFTSFGRNLILNCGILIILIYHWSKLIYCSKNGKTYANMTDCELIRGRVFLSPESLLHTCWETWLGQRVLIYLLVNLVISFGFYIFVDIFKSIVLYSPSSFIKPKFFYSSFISNLCYMDCLFWFGYYYSPFISFLWFIIILLLFFYNLNVISVSCFPHGFSSQSVDLKRSMFLLMVLTSSLIGIVTLASHSLIFKTSKGCGPFTHLEYNYDSEELYFPNIIFEDNFIKKVFNIGEQLLLSDGLGYAAIIVFLSVAVKFTFRVKALHKIHYIALRKKVSNQEEKNRSAESCQELLEKLKTKNSPFILSSNTLEDEEVIKEYNNFVI